MPLHPSTEIIPLRTECSVLKAGAFRSLSSLYKVEKLHPNSHLYTSGHFLPDFPGRKFRITSSCGFGKKEVKEMLAAEKKANLTVRNFPATVAELRKRLKLAEGEALISLPLLWQTRRRYLSAARLRDKTPTPIPSPARDVHLMLLEMYISYSPRCTSRASLASICQMTAKGDTAESTTSKNLCNLIVTESLSVLQRSAIST